MGLSFRGLLYSLALTPALTVVALASPLNSRLLALVPPGAEIVSGFENHHVPPGHGQLVLNTRNNRIDLDDWQALAGVDSKRAFEQVIEVAASVPGRGMLSEHMVLVEGRLDKEQIFRAAELNGSQRADCEGQSIMLIEPFTREKGEMRVVRWLAILDNRIGILGTPYLVQSALHRFLTHADIDMPLMERLSQLRRDDTSWNVMLWAPRVLKNYSAEPPGAWGRLMEGAEVVMVGARFGSKVCIDFTVHATDRGTEFFKTKAAAFGEVFGLSPQTGAPQPRGLSDVSFESNRVQGSIKLSWEQYEEWGKPAKHPHIYLVPRYLSHGE